MKPTRIRVIVELVDDHGRERRFESDLHPLMPLETIYKSASFQLQNALEKIPLKIANGTHHD